MPLYCIGTIVQIEMCRLLSLAKQKLLCYNENLE